MRVTGEVLILRKRKTNMVCVFCGKSPVDKTDEHLIPKWLLKLVGVLDVNINIGFIDGKEVKGKDFHTPACYKCNKRYSNLENHVSSIFKSIIFEKANLDRENSTLLLDWFDKIRMGLWFLFWYENHKNTVPTFSINERIGVKDRCLFIFYTKDIYQGFQVFGLSPIFECFPTAICLRVGQLCMINISNDFFSSKKLGLPVGIIETNENDTNIKISGNPVLLDGYVSEIDFFEKKYKGVTLLQSIYSKDLSKYSGEWKSTFDAIKCETHIVRDKLIKLFPVVSFQNKVFGTNELKAFEILRYGKIDEKELQKEILCLQIELYYKYHDKLSEWNKKVIDAQKGLLKSFN